jgi:hypothetical protein
MTGHGSEYELHPALAYRLLFLMLSISYPGHVALYNDGQRA